MTEGVVVTRLACRGPIEEDAPTHPIWYDGRMRLIHQGCSGKNHPDVKRWEDLIKADAHLGAKNKLTRSKKGKGKKCDAVG